MKIPENPNLKKPKLKLQILRLKKWKKEWLRSPISLPYTYYCYPSSVPAVPAHKVRNAMGGVNVCTFSYNFTVHIEPDLI